MTKKRDIPCRFRDPDYQDDFYKKEVVLAKISGVLGTLCDSLKQNPLYCYLKPSRTAAETEHDVSATSIWRGLKEITTSHGIPHLDSARGLVKRSFWTAMVILALAMLIFNLYSITGHYLSYSVDVVIKLKHDNELLFPAVTFCNMNAFRRSAVENVVRSLNWRDVTTTSKGVRRRKRATCDSGWYAYSDKCYFFSTDEHMWTNAEDECHQLGAELTSILDEDEMTFITSITDDKKNYWIGLRKDDNTDIWSWSDGNDLAYANWRPREPGSRDNCARIKKDEGWDSKSCYTVDRYICKRGGVSTVAPPETTTAVLTAAPSSEQAPTTDSRQEEITTGQSTTASTTNAEMSSASTNQMVTSLPSTAQTTVIRSLTSESTELVTSSVTTPEVTSESVSSPESNTPPETRAEERSTHVTDEPTEPPTTDGRLTTTEQHQTTPTPEACCTFCFRLHELSSYAYNRTECAEPTTAGQDGRTATPTTAMTQTGRAEVTVTPQTSPRTERQQEASDVTTPPGARPVTTSDLNNETSSDDYLPASGTLMELLSDLSEEDKITIGFRLTDLILDVRYSGYTVPLRDFVHFYNPVHGNCYTFNSDWSGKAGLRKSLKAGRRHGLHVILNVDQKEYIPGLTDTAGVRMVVHPKERLPFPEDEGITLSPGQTSSVGLRKVRIERQGYPYGDCLYPEDDHSDINVYESLLPVHYSLKACKKTCYQKYVMDACGCGDPTLPLFGKPLAETPVPACRSTNRTQDQCLNAAQKNFNVNSSSCGCKSLCTDTSYTMKLSFGQWPSRVQKNDILNRLASAIGDSFDISDPTEYKKNLAKVEVYFEEFNFEQITERPSYTASSFLSHLGGDLGLWVGFSFLTVAEFLELGLDLMVISGVACLRSYRRRKQLVSDENGSKGSKVMT